jgi:hypothetical protein
MRITKWIVSSIDHPAAHSIGEALDLAMIPMEARFRNALKTTNFAKDTFKDIILNLTVELITIPLDMAVNKILWDRTGKQVSIGLSEAKTVSTSQIDISILETHKANVTKNVSNLVDPIIVRGNSVSGEFENLEKGQEAAGFIADFADAAYSVVQYTGPVNWLSAALKTISILTRLVDAMMSSYYMSRWYSIFTDSYSGVQEVTNISFSQQSSSWLNQNQTVVNDGFSLDLINFCVVPGSRGGGGASIYDSTEMYRWFAEGISYHPPRSHDKPEYIPLLSDFSKTQLRTLDAEINDFNDLLDQLIVFVDRGDALQSETIIQKILEEDVALNNAFSIAEYPVYAGASELVGDGTVDTFDIYSQFGSRGAAFDAASAGFYLSLLTWTTDPDNREIQNMLLDQINLLKTQGQSYQDSINEARPLVEDFIKQPSVFITKYSVPDEIKTGDSFVISVEITNPTPTKAENALMQLEYETANSEIFSEAISVGEIASGGVHNIDFQVNNEVVSGFAVLEIEISNGNGDRRMIPLPIVDQENNVNRIVPRGSNITGFLIISVVLAFGILGVYIAATRRRKVTVPSARAHGRLILSGGQTINLHDNFIIGRGSASSYRIPDSSVSRQHARFRFAEGAWFIQDMGSMGGTYVNGQRVQAQKLNYGDQITVGNTSFTFSQD